eukprot:TRINITY_DN14290_c0_g2_i1.p1 TRINITY_DN14290_c0_g2~~TRINITY_DN14290_c0_g2_i1.p1  ORF type:complete len:450 (+),score=65.52 TRINITY_DN14290_c0_g2_i1:54-1403(+)
MDNITGIPPPPLSKFEPAKKYYYDTTVRADSTNRQKWKNEKTHVYFEKKRKVGRGGMRDCYLVWESDGQSAHQMPYQMIGKIFQADIQSTLEDYMNEAITQCVADTFAQEYNKLGVPNKISFLACYVVKLASKGPNGEDVVFTMEPMLKGIYEKHNNNVGQVFTQNHTAEAFSHFTFESSNKKLLVCDLQGVGGMYTDPQIHSVDGGEEFGLGNLGSEGIRKWLATHKCGPLCTALGFPPIGAEAPVKKRPTGRPTNPPPPRSAAVDHQNIVQEMRETFRRACGAHSPNMPMVKRAPQAGHPMPIGVSGHPAHHPVHHHAPHHGYNPPIRQAGRAAPPPGYQAPVGAGYGNPRPVPVPAPQPHYGAHQANGHYFRPPAPGPAPAPAVPQAVPIRPAANPNNREPKIFDDPKMREAVHQSLQEERNRLTNAKREEERLALAIQESLRITR